MTTDLKTLLSPISKFVRTLDLTNAASAENSLNRSFPPQSPGIAEIRNAAMAALETGTICQRGEPGMKFSRVVKPEHDAANCSIDAVFMTNGSGPIHTHTKGEVCLCLPREDTPAFDGRTDTWVVMPSGSRHAPTVTGGSMLIIYWWPDGAVEWA